MYQSQFSHYIGVKLSTILFIAKLASKSFSVIYIHIYVYVYIYRHF